MSTVRVIESAWVSVKGTNRLLVGGTEYDARDPLVRSFPGLFTPVLAPEPPKKAPGRRPRNA